MIEVVLLLLWLESGEVVVQPASEAECRQVLADLAAAGGGTVETASGRQEIVRADCVAAPGAMRAPEGASGEAGT